MKRKLHKAPRAERWSTAPTQHHVSIASTEHQQGLTAPPNYLSPVPTQPQIRAELCIHTKKWPAPVNRREAGGFLECEGMLGGWNVRRLKHGNGVHVNTGWILHEDCEQQWRENVETSAHGGGCRPSEHHQASPSFVVGQSVADVMN
ncbi:hypothetical protein EYF80_016821 [Liparis tanakae]|uniref:Uncharacterized protein n=1 Tax=Liparis tanakae TaxID=230148 RepID=A0A4Z2I6H8_9TELE|nr:hypothetical protein EYF80_016821 [Liparis tanakae]